MKLYLIRHTAVNVPEGVCYGQADVPLKASFNEEAETVLSKIQHLDFDAVYSSPLSRCVKLAQYCGFSDVVMDDRLQELNFGDWEMQYWDAIDDPNLTHWYTDWLTTKATHGESFHCLYQRFCAFIEQLPSQLEQVALFTHGGIINCARIYGKLTTVDKMFDNTPSYGSVTELTLMTK